MRHNGKVLRVEDRPSQERVFLHIEAVDEDGGYGTVVSFSYAELKEANITDNTVFIGVKCICDPYPHREDFGILR